MLTADFNFLYPRNIRRGEAWRDYFSVAIDVDYENSLEICEENHVPLASVHFNDYLRQSHARRIQSLLSEV